MGTSALRRLPSIDAFLRELALAALPRSVVTRVARSYLDEVRDRVRAGVLDGVAVDELFASGAAVAEVSALRRLPSIDAFLREPVLAALPRSVVTRVARSYLDEV